MNISLQAPKFLRVKLTNHFMFYQRLIIVEKTKEGNVRLRVLLKSENDWQPVPPLARHMSQSMDLASSKLQYSHPENGIKNTSSYFLRT